MTLTRSYLLCALVCALMVFSPIANAAVGDRALTQMALQSAEWEYDNTVITSNNAAFTGSYVDPTDGTLFATYLSGIMRIPAGMTTTGTPAPVTNFRQSATSQFVYAPCTAGGTAGWQYVNCGNYAGGSYLGLTQALYFDVGGTVSAQQIGTPWVNGSRVFSIGLDGNSGNPTLYNFDKSSFSLYDNSYNPIPFLALGTPKRVLFDQVNMIAYVGTNNDGGYASIVSIPMATYSATSTWGVVNFPAGTAMADIAWDGTPTSAPTLFTMVGTSGASNVIWTASVPATGVITSYASLPSATYTPTACASNGITVAYDNLNSAGPTLFIGCSALAVNGSYTLGALIRYSVNLAYNPPTLSPISNLYLTRSDGPFSTWFHDPINAIIYIGLQGIDGSGGYAEIVQVSLDGPANFTFVREGRTETSSPVNIKSIVFAGYVNNTAPSYMRPGAATFYAMGIDTTTLYPAMSLWTGAQGCQDQCGQYVYTSQNPRGSCSRRTCTCNSLSNPIDYAPFGGPIDWLGPWCASLTCYQNCNGQGLCSNGTCACDPLWKNTTSNSGLCQTRRCPNDCNGHGTCDTANNYTCNCEIGWTFNSLDGLGDCSSQTYYPCQNLTSNCTGCTQNPSCVWCASSRTCMDGGVNGPADTSEAGYCRSWYWQNCGGIIGISIMNYILTAILGIVLAISLFSGTLNDTASEDPERRTEWYLFQRAGKLWSMVSQLQLVAISGLIDFEYPTSFYGFVRFWNWILLSWGMPWRQDHGFADGWADSSVTTARSTSNYEQYESYAKVGDHELFYGWLIWFGVGLGAFLVMYLIMVLIAVIRGGRVGFLATTRPIYILLRMLELGHLGLCVMGPLAIIRGGNSAIVGGVLWGVFAIVLPIGLSIWLGFLKDKKGLFQPKFAGSCYPYYGAYDFRYRWIVFAPWVKRILIGLFIGFINSKTISGYTNYAIAQVALVAVVNLAWLAFVILLRNQYSDYLQRYLEIILAAVNLVAFLVLFGFLSDSPTTASAVGIVFLILEFLSVVTAAAFFIISWLQLNQVYSVGQCIKFCTCRGSE